MTDHKDIIEGGPAFPLPDRRLPFWTGMTLRDYFAGQALAGLCANPTWDDAFHPKNLPNTARWIYEVADAVLEARKPKEPSA